MSVLALGAGQESRVTSGVPDVAGSMRGAAASDYGSRFLLFTNECVGLGHLRRGLHVAAALAAGDPAASSLILTGAPAIPDEATPPGVAVVTLPALGRDMSGDYRSRSLTMSADRLFQLRAQIALSTAVAFNPRVVLVDKVPLGLGSELLPALTALREAGDCRIVLGLRDIEDDPESVRARWRSQGLKRVLRRLYDAVLVYGPASGAGLDAISCVGGEDLGLPVHHVGYIGGPVPTRRPDDLPARYVLVTAGGGTDGFDLARAAIEAVRRRPIAMSLVVVAGPMMGTPEYDDLRSRAEGLDVRVHRFRADMTATVAAARAVISMAGYNTVSDVLRAGRPVLLVPRVRPSREQLLRAERLRDSGQALMLHPDELTPGSLRSAIDTLLHREPAPSSSATYAGAARAAMVLRTLAEGAGT